ncbi:MAG: CvpA family protein [Clostridiales bacterium]|nr:CvpA family protein [Clostridiales bacterium]
MNYIDIIFIALIFLFTFIGYKRGLIYSVLSFARAFVGVPLSVFVSNSYSGVIYDEYVREYAVNSISNQLDSSLNLESTVKSISEFIDSLPQFLTKSADLAFLNDITVQNAAEQTVDNIIEPLALALIKFSLFVITLVIFYALTGIIIKLVRNLTSKRKKGIVSGANHFLGAVFGLFKSFVSVCLLSAVISLILSFTSADSGSFFKELSESSIAEFVNQFNLYNF